MRERRCGRAGPPAGDPHGEEIEAEEERCDDAIEVAVKMLGREVIAGADQAGRADEAKEEPADDLAADALRREQTGAEHHPYRRHGAEEGRVGDGRVQDGKVPEQEVGRKGKAGEQDRPVEAKGAENGSPAMRASRRPRPRGAATRRQPARGAGERADIGEPHEDRRNAHRQCAEKKRGERHGHRWRGGDCRRRGSLGSRLSGPAIALGDARPFLWHHDGRVTILRLERTIGVAGLEIRLYGRNRRYNPHRTGSGSVPAAGRAPAGRTDVQNIDLMNLAGFCRNCLSNWYQDAAAARGLTLDKSAAREIIYGMPYTEWQAPLSDRCRPAAARCVREESPTALRRGRLDPRLHPGQAAHPDC